MLILILAMSRMDQHLNKYIPRPEKIGNLVLNLSGNFELLSVEAEVLSFILDVATEPTPPATLQ